MTVKVWRCIALVLCLSAGTSQAQTSFNARTWLFTQNVTRAASEARFLQWFQAESLELNILAREETNVLHQLGPLDLSATNLLHVWECATETNIHTVFFAVTGTVEDATNGHVIYRVTPAAANLLDGNYLGFARVLQNVNGTNVRMGVLQQQRIQVIESVDSELYDIVGPISSTDYVQRIDYGGQSGATPQITRTGNVYNIVWPAAGAGDMLTSTYDTDTNGVVDNAAALGGTAAAAYATDVELTAATNALAVTIATKIGSSGVTFENADANGDVGTDTNQFARGSAVTTEATVRATADTALATTQSQIRAIAEAGTNRVGALEVRLLAMTNNFTFAGTTITNPCGVSIAMIYSGAESMQVTGCMAYLNIPDTNGPAAAGGAATNYTVIYNNTTNTGSAIVFATGGSITNVILTNGQVVVQSKDETGGGGSGGYTAIPTNPHGFRVMYVFNSGTNFSTFEGTKLILMTNAANVVYDTGIADGFGRPYWNTTNSTWSQPKGKARVTHFLDTQQPAALLTGIGFNDMRTATNAFGSSPAFEDKFASWNTLYTSGPGLLGQRGPGCRIWESPDATNTYYIFGRCGSGCYNLYGSDLTVEILTQEP